MISFHKTGISSRTNGFIGNRARRNLESSYHILQQLRNCEIYSNSIKIIFMNFILKKLPQMFYFQLKTGSTAIP